MHVTWWEHTVSINYNWKIVLKNWTPQSWWSRDNARRYCWNCCRECIKSDEQPARVLNATLILVRNIGNPKKEVPPESSRKRKMEKSCKARVLAWGLVRQRQIAELKQSNRLSTSTWNWKIINDISYKLTQWPTGKVKRFNGDIINLHKSSLRSDKIFLNFLNAPHATSTREILPAKVGLEIKAGGFDHEGIDKTIKYLNYYKAPGFVYNIKDNEIWRWRTSRETS